MKTSYQQTITGRNLLLITVLIAICTLFGNAGAASASASETPAGASETSTSTFEASAGAEAALASSNITSAEASASAGEASARGLAPSDKMRIYESLMASFQAHRTSGHAQFTEGMAAAMSLHLAKSSFNMLQSTSNRQIVFLTQAWNASEENWENEDRSYQYVDQAGRITEIGFQSFEDGQWINEFRTLMEYEGTSQNVSILMSHAWDREEEAWYDNDYRTRFVRYNNHGYPLEVIYDLWSLENWEPWERDLISYVNDTQYDIIRNFDWAHATSAWVLQGRETWTYDNGHVTQILWENGHKDDEMEPSERELFEYDGNWNNTLWMWQQYIDDWVGFVQNIMTYENNILQEDLFQMWNEEDEAWRNILKTVYDEYDARGNTIMETDYLYLFDDWIGSSRSIHEYDNDDQLLVTTMYGWLGVEWFPYARILYGAMVPSHADETVQVPLEAKLFQNYPNPFNPSTTIRFNIPERVHVELTVFNTLGQAVGRLIDREMEAGRHEVVFDASHLPSGAYIYRLKAGNHIASKKLMLLK